MKNSNFSVKVKNVVLSAFALSLITSFAAGQSSQSSLKGINNWESENPTIKSIQKYLESHNNDFNLKLSDIKQWEVTDDYFSLKGKVRHVYLRQTIDGLTVVNGIANITLNNRDSVLYFSSNFISNVEDRYTAISKKPIHPKKAIKYAAQHLQLKGKRGKKINTLELNQYRFKKGSLSREDVDVTYRLWSNGEELRAVWIVSIHVLSGDHWWQLFIDAQTGEELNRIDWVKSCSFSSDHKNHDHANMVTPVFMPTPPPGTDQYNVFAFPVESPNHGSSSLQVGPYNSNSSPFGWHDEDGVSGAEFTITRGNNVFAYEDINDDDLPGFSPDGGASLDFNFPINLNQNPSAYQASAITNLFYINNRIHDILFEYGFDEQSGNFQITNYTGSGLGQDHVLAEAQDGGGTNNANFSTPPDGSTPRMQMYLWTNNSGVSNLLTVNSPSGIAGSYSAAEATFGPGVSTTPITADLVLWIDGTAPADDGCETATNGAAISGKIAVIYRGSCNFVTKVANAQTAGAVAVIMINNAAGAAFAMGGADPTITIPSIMISNIDGATLVNEIMNSTVNATIVNGSGNFQKDGDFDNGIISHEYGHGVSTRLTGGPSNSDCLYNSEQMGEGWSDFIGLMLTTDLSVANPVYRPIGTYATSEVITGNGIRNAPYDTSFVINNYTYADVADVGNVSEPHGIGFVWCTMLWDLNWAFIDQYGFDSNIETGSGGNNLVLQLVIEAMKLQPCSPGFVDGRNAILQADQLLNGGVNQCLIWKAFAKRGLGYSADQGSSSSRSDQTEAFDLPPICQLANNPPIADFAASTFITCSGEVQFEDLSTDTPQDWLWNFGDGNTSTQQDPFHTYTSSGIYSVTLEVTNTEGSDVLTMTNLIEVALLTSPSVTDGFGCPADSIQLIASGTNVMQWMDSTGNILSNGNIFYAPPSNSTTSYYVANTEGFSVFNIGPVDNTIGAAAYHNTEFVGAINFTADTKLIIYSAWVDAETPGIRQITLSSGYNTTGTFGTPIEVIDVNIPFSGPGRIDLGITVPGPGQYSLGLNNAGLSRNSAGANYPYTAPGLMTIESSSATTNALAYYYYFYDLEIGEPNCSSDTIEVTAFVEQVNYSWTITNQDVAFTNLSIIGTSWSWDFGDVSSSNLEDPNHTYVQDGIYTVTLTVDGNCSISYDIVIGNVGNNELNPNNFQLSVFPNPAENETNLLFNTQINEDIAIKLFSLEGKLLREYSASKGSDEITLSLIGISPQMCYLNVISNKGEQQMKVIIQ
jgi:extracellular elastinolytic metalloproteinase